MKKKDGITPSWRYEEGCRPMLSFSRLTDKSGYRPVR
jgi:hypothetical protein